MMFKFIFRAIALLIAIIVAIPAYALFVTWNSANNPSLRTAADVIVIPGAAQLDGTPGPVLQALRPKLPSEAAAPSTSRSSCCAQRLRHQ